MLPTFARYGIYYAKTRLEQEDKIALVAVAIINNDNGISREVRGKKKRERELPSLERLAFFCS